MSKPKDSHMKNVLNGSTEPRTTSRKKRRDVSLSYVTSKYTPSTDDDKNMDLHIIL